MPRRARRRDATARQALPSRLLQRVYNAVLPRVRGRGEWLPSLPFFSARWHCSEPARWSN